MEPHDLIVKCPECGAVSMASQWRDTEVYCEDCGDHNAKACPNPRCDFRFDVVFHGFGDYRAELGW